MSNLYLSQEQHSLRNRSLVLLCSNIFSLSTLLFGFLKRNIFFSLSRWHLPGLFLSEPRAPTEVWDTQMFRCSNVGAFHEWHHLSHYSLQVISMCRHKTSRGTGTQFGSMVNCPLRMHFCAGCKSWEHDTWHQTRLITTQADKTQWSVYVCNKHIKYFLI